MFLALWEFDVKLGCDEGLKSAYGPGWGWAPLVSARSCFATNSPPG